jgi:hypothetical protein
VRHAGGACAHGARSAGVRCAAPGTIAAAHAPPRPVKRAQPQSARTFILITLPSLLGLKPRSDVCIAFSTSSSADLSYTLIMSVSASGVVTLARDCSGVGAP